jgi:hypothetical protein
MWPLLFLAFVPQQVGHSRYVIDPPGELLETAWRDADGNGTLDLWLASAENGKRKIHLYLQQDGGGFSTEPSRTFGVSAGVVGWAVGDFLGGEGWTGAEIIFTTRNGIWVQPNQGTRPKKIFEVELLLELPSAKYLPQWKEIADFNGDGFDELVVPTRTGILVLEGTGKVLGNIPISPQGGRPPVASAEFLEGFTAKLSSQDLSDLFVPNEEQGVMTPPPILYAEARLPIPSIADINGDGRLDISWYRNRKLYFHLQTEAGTFQSKPDATHTVPTDEARREKRIEWVNVGGTPAADLLILRTTKGLKLSSDWQIRVYLDFALHSFDREPDFFRKVEGVFVIPYFADLNGDHRVDVCLSAWNSSGLLSLREPHVSHKFLVFPALAEGGFAKRAQVPHSATYPIETLDSFSIAPAISMDLDGVGGFDFLQSTGKGTLESLPFDSDVAFSLQKSNLEFSIDVLGSVVEIRDLNQDGVGDILVRRLDSWEIFITHRRL